MNVTYENKVESILKQASSFDEALHIRIKYTMEVAKAQYAVVWLIDKSKETLVPYYWLCPLDITTKSYELKAGVLQDAVKKHSVISKLIYKNDDTRLDEILAGIEISSLICLPLCTSRKTIGCVLLFNSSLKPALAEEAVEIGNSLKTAFSKTNFGKINYQLENKEVIFSLNNIYKDFTNGDIVTNVLKGINLDILSNEFLVLLGPSGCGKTTLLNIIGGMDTPTSGEISFYDQNLTKANQEELTNYRRDNIGFIFQSYNLMPNLTAKQNLDLIGELVKNPLDSKYVLSLVELSDKQNNYPSQLSGGQQQRISIARALVKNPIAIMADEPTAALDYKTSIGVLNVLQNITKQNKTLIMVTHNEEIGKLANRVVRLRDGKVYEVSINLNPAKADDLVW